jgi:hypothetical protein
MEASDVILIIFKCYFAYLSVRLLKHHVSRLKISTTENKITAVRKITFSNTLKELKNEIGFFNYYRNYVEYYASVIQPLNNLKIINFKLVFKKGIARDRFADFTSSDLNDFIKALLFRRRALLLDRAKAA